MMWIGLQTYPTELQMGLLGVEMASVLDNLGTWHLKLKQYGHAENAFQQALAFLQKNTVSGADDIKKASSLLFYHLGYVAQGQREWEQAEHYYQQALSIDEKYQNRYSQALVYHPLGQIAQEQNYQQALQLKIEYQDRYKQASTYHNLGKVAQGQRKWEGASHYLLQVLELLVKYDDGYSTSIALGNLARLWRDSGDTELPAAIASVLKMTKDEMEQGLRGMLEDGDA